MIDYSQVKGTERNEVRKMKLDKRTREFLERRFKEVENSGKCELEIGTPFDASITSGYDKDHYDIEFSMWWIFKYVDDEDGCVESFKTENGINNVKIPCSNPDEVTTFDLMEILSEYVLEDTIKSFEDHKLKFNDDVPF